MIKMSGLTFDNTSKDYLTVRGKRRLPWAPLRRKIINILGRPGAILEGTDVDPLPIAVDVFIEQNDFSNLERTKEDLAAWLITETPKELIFDDDPERCYDALVDGTLDLDEIVRVGWGTILFICLDPYKYGPVKKAYIENGLSFNVDGSVETYPIITTKLKEDTTFVAVSNGEMINMVGRPMDVDEVAFEPETRILWDDMSTTVGWADSNSVEEGIKAGVMKSNGYAFLADDYGTGTHWHGPPVKKSLSSPIQDFRVDALIKQIGKSGQVGSVEIAGLDASNNFVFKLTMTKRSKDSPAVWAELRAGSVSNGHDIMNERGATDWTWDNFDGMLSLQRVGNQWTAFVGKLDENGFNSRSQKTWTDSTSIATAPVTQIQVQLWQYSTIPTTFQRIEDIKVYQVNTEPDKVPIIGRAGDIVEFNHQDDIITLNGIDITKHKAFIGSYFPLAPGINSLSLEPVDLLEETEARWKPRWR